MHKLHSLSCSSPEVKDAGDVIVRMAGHNPIKICLFSGKRKSGKDFLTDLIYERLGHENVAIIKISGPIKSHWAREKGLDLNQLLDSTEYKEQHRKDMIEWSEGVRRVDYGYFCSAAIQMYKAELKPIWIVSDIRRKTDVRWFKENYGHKVSTYRVTCDNSVRKQRGWIFTPGIDDQETECDLDDVTRWDHIVENSGSKDDVDVIVNDIVKELSLL